MAESGFLKSSPFSHQCAETGVVSPLNDGQGRMETLPPPHFSSIVYPLLWVNRYPNQILLGIRETSGLVVDVKPPWQDHPILLRLKLYNLLFSWPPDNEFFGPCYDQSC